MSFDGPEKAGVAGKAIGDLVEGGLGFVASGLVLLAIGIVSVFLLADTDIQTLERDIRRLWPKRKPKPAAPKEQQYRLTEPPAKPAKRKKAPVVEAEPIQPIINIPKREPAPTAGQSKPKVISEAPEPDVPLPLPDVRLLSYYDQVEPDKGELETNARVIEETLQSFKVQARVREINPGPAVTQFAIEPGNGVKVRRISELHNDLALSLAPSRFALRHDSRRRVESDPDKQTTVGLREVLESRTVVNGKWKLPLPLGRDVNGRAVVGDLAKMPHLLIAGATGAGKSVCLNGIISTFLMYKRPDELKMLMIDPKMVELTGFNGVPHLLCPVVTEMEKASRARMVRR